MRNNFWLEAISLMIILFSGVGLVLGQVIDSEDFYHEPTFFEGFEIMLGIDEPTEEGTEVMGEFVENMQTIANNYDFIEFSAEDVFSDSNIIPDLDLNTFNWPPIMPPRPASPGDFNNPFDDDPNFPVVPEKPPQGEEFPEDTNPSPNDAPVDTNPGGEGIPVDDEFENPIAGQPVDEKDLPKGTVSVPADGNPDPEDTPTITIPQMCGCDRILIMGGSGATTNQEGQPFKVEQRMTQLKFNYNDNGALGTKKINSNNGKDTLAIGSAVEIVPILTPGSNPDLCREGQLVNSKRTYGNNIERFQVIDLKTGEPIHHDVIDPATGKPNPDVKGPEMWIKLPSEENPNYGDYENAMNDLTQQFGNVGRGLSSTHPGINRNQDTYMDDGYHNVQDAYSPQISGDNPNSPALQSGYLSYSVPYLKSLFLALQGKFPGDSEQELIAKAESMGGASRTGIKVHRNSGSMDVKNPPHVAWADISSLAIGDQVTYDMIKSDKKLSQVNKFVVYIIGKDGPSCYAQYSVTNSLLVNGNGDIEGSSSISIDQESTLVDGFDIPHRPTGIDDATMS